MAKGIISGSKNLAKTRQAGPPKGMGKAVMATPLSTPKAMPPSMNMVPAGKPSGRQKALAQTAQPAGTNVGTDGTVMDGMPPTGIAPKKMK